MDLSRRDFMVTAALASLASRTQAQQQSTNNPSNIAPVQSTGKGFGASKPPILVSSANGWNGIDVG